MAIKKIEMRPEGTNDYGDILYPKTGVDNIDGLNSYSVATGTNAYVTTANMITSLTPGIILVVKFTNASTGATTINVNGLGAKAIVKPGGGSPKIKAGGMYTLAYDGTSFHLLGEGGEYGNAIANQVLAPNTFGTDNGLVTGTMPNRGAPTTTLTTQGGQYNISPGYFSGGSVKAQFANLVAGNIKKGVNIGGVIGTCEEKYGPLFIRNDDNTDPDSIYYFESSIRTTSAGSTTLNYTVHNDGQINFETYFYYGQNSKDFSYTQRIYKNNAIFLQNTTNINDGGTGTLNRNVPINVVKGDKLHASITISGYMGGSGYFWNKVRYRGNHFSVTRE